MEEDYVDPEAGNQRQNQGTEDEEEDTNIIPAIVKEVTTTTSTTTTTPTPPHSQDGKLLIPGGPFGMGWKTPPPKTEVAGTAERKSTGIQILDDLKQKLSLGGGKGLFGQ